MPLLGPAAMFLAFDVEPEAITEHDYWHTHEHMPERLSIPGFLRGTRWVALDGKPRYAVLYEVAALATLTSAAYLARLNDPSAWTARMMPHYRGMVRGLCTVVASTGLGTGHVAHVARFAPSRDEPDRAQRWLANEILPALADKPGIASAHLLRGATRAPMTHEQRIRGTDAGVDLALLVTAYDVAALGHLARDLIGTQHLEREAAAVTAEGRYRLDYTLSHLEVPGPGAGDAA